MKLNILLIIGLLVFTGCSQVEKEYKSEMVYDDHTGCYRLQTFEKIPENHINSEHWLFVSEDFPCYSENDLEDTVRKVIREELKVLKK